MADEKKHPLKEITQPFIDLVHAPRALWGVNLPYFIEGVAYWGFLGYLAMYFNKYAGLNDVHAGWMVGIQTAGITIAMFFLGGLADRWGVRATLLAAFVCLIAGRVFLPLGPAMGLGSTGLWSPVHLFAMLGILLIVIGYGMYQPAAYAAVRQFTTKKTAAMGFAMLYALMNFGGWIPTWMTPVRERYGITGAYWVYIVLTVLALCLTGAILTRKIVRQAIDEAKAEREKEGSKPKEENTTDPEPAAGEKQEIVLPLGFWAVVGAVLAGVSVLFFYWPREMPEYLRPIGVYVSLFLLLVYGVIPGRWRNAFRGWVLNHPLADAKFSFFIFCLIPVQTLFAHNWLTLPMYVERGFRETWPWISVNFEKAVNFNPLLIFILVPIVTALTQKRKVYNMMIVGTFVMAAPTFLLALGATPWTLVTYLIVMTIGEAMWQPRFLQYAAEIAPEGRTGAYMGVAQFPWFLTKVIVPVYSGWFLQRYCPEEGPPHTETMWLIYALIAISSTVILILAKGWVGRDFKTKAD